VVGEGAAKKYAAYICDSHRDEKDAAWLHRPLERDRIPRVAPPSDAISPLGGTWAAWIVGLLGRPEAKGISDGGT
jgi:hypothetical protein